MQNGAEYNNTVQRNVIGCESQGWLENNKCALVGGPSSQDNSDRAEQSGIYMLSPQAADMFENHVFLTDNAFFANQQAGKAWGQDIADGKVAAKVAPIAQARGNVFHDNSGFGWYINEIPSRLEPALPIMHKIEP